MFKFLAKSDAKVVAKSIAAVFKKVNNQYDVTYATVANHWIQYDKGLRNRKPLEMAANNQLPNLAMLAVAEINALLEKRNTPFEQSKERHYETVVAYLKKQNIPLQYIDGNNSKTSKQAADTIKIRIKEKDIASN